MNERESLPKWRCGWQKLGSMARAWLDMQTAYDLSRIDPTQIKVKPYAPETGQDTRVP